MNRECFCCPRVATGVIEVDDRLYALCTKHLRQVRRILVSQVAPRKELEGQLSLLG